MVRPRALPRILRVGVAGGVLAVVVSRVGTEPFRAALGHTTVSAVVTALAVTAVVTACSARRWVVVARALDLDLGTGAAVLAYYRSQLLNVTLPGGVVGDVQRAWRHGEVVAARGPAARAVVWERAIGFTALVATTGVLVLVAPGGLRHLVRPVGWVLAGVVGVLVVTVLLLRRHPPRTARLAVLGADVRLLARSRDVPTAWALSVVGVCGHLVVLVIALRAAGVTAPLTSVLPLLASVLLASTIPASVAGWGPREGAAAVVFPAAGLDAATGVTVAAVYGVLTLVVALPGVVVMLLPAARAHPLAVGG